MTAKIKRTFKKDAIVMHDLYKLEVSLMLKNMAIDGQAADYLKLEHCHIYHTVDSRGLQQKHCSPIGGHFHIIEVVKAATDSEPAVLKCSGPKKFVLDAKTKQKKIVDYDAADQHTHEITYISSEQFKPRKVNLEASKYVAHVQAKEPAPVPGIIG